MAKKTHDGSVPLAELKKRAGETRTLLAKIRALYPDATAIARDDRITSQGKMGVREATALRSVIHAVELEPAIFGVLADEDEGHDPGKLETELIHDRFERHQIYAELAEELESLAGVFSDAALEMGALVKPVALAAYEIAKPLSKRHKGIREKIAPALDYYGANASAAVAARKAKRASKDAE